MKITKEQLKQIIKEELEETYRPDYKGMRDGTVPRERSNYGADHPATGTDVYGKPMGSGPAVSDEPPVENLEADAEQIIRLLSMGLVNTTKIMNPELKALVLDMRPDLARRIV